VASSIESQEEEPKPGRRQWLISHWPKRTRYRVAAVLAILAIIVAALVASANLWTRLRNPELDFLGYASLFVACWIGAGGALVPIPGVRAISWVMIVQQGATLDPLVVTAVAASAMVLGQTSYFMATRTALARARRHAAAHPAAPTTPSSGPPTDTTPAESATHGRLATLMLRARDAIESQIERHGFVTVFVVCTLPTPLTTLTTTAAADSGMPYWRYFIAAAGGFLVLSGALAFVGDELFGGFLQNLGR
jgi:uncharacterized membrane protein YdjX (TVP38/TMEM64 family)